MQYALNGNVISLVVRDVHTKFGAVYPANDKTSSSTIEALQRFIGDDKVKRFYSDNAEELIAAARELMIPHEASQQGMPETNGIIERKVQDMLCGTRTVMFAAGLPGYVWSFAAPCYMYLDQCTPHLVTGLDAWSQRYGAPFPGQLIPFGAAVWFKPAKTKLVTDKPLPTGVFGVFSRYRFAPGGTWNGEYLVEEMT